MLIQICGVPGTGKSTIAARMADARPWVFLRIDAIEAAMWRAGLAKNSTGIAAYSVAHAVAESHLRRGQTVIVEAVSAVEEARAGWRSTASSSGTTLCVIETICPDRDMHRSRVETRRCDIDGFTLPTWRDVEGLTYEPRDDARLLIDTSQPLDACVKQALDYVTRFSAAG